MIKIADEIKAKVIIEADTSGAEEAAAALEKLQGMAGNFGSSGAGGANDALAEMGKQAEVASKALVPLGENAQEAFAPLAEGEAAVSELNDALGGHQQTLLDTAEAYKALPEPIGATVTQLQAAQEPIAMIAQHAQSLHEQLGNVSDGFAQMQQAFDPQMLMQASQAYQALPAPLEAYAKQLQAVSESTSNIVDSTAQIIPSEPLLSLPDPAELAAFHENMSAFNDALDHPQPFSMLGQYLKETGQSWSDFTDSIGFQNTNVLQDLATSGGTVNETLGQMNENVQATGKTFASTFADTQAFTDQYNALGGAAQTASENVTSLGSSTEQAGQSFSSVSEDIANVNKTASEGFFGNYFGGLGDFIFGGAPTGEGGISAGLFSKGMTAAGAETPSLFEGAVMGFEQLARPLMMVQMVAQMATMMGQAIYNSAAIAEGPGAHGFGTFTGAVDSLGYTMQQVGGSFSESFGKQFMATLDAINQAVGDNSQGLSNTGGMLGGALSFAGNLLMGGLGVGLMATGVGIPLGFTMAQAGMEGIANNLAQWTGLPPEFTGQQATPAMQVGAQVQQGWSQIPTQVITDTAGSINNTNKILTEASDPQFIDAQNQLSHAQQYMQHVQQQYGAAHPYNQVQEALQSQNDYSTMQDNYAVAHPDTYWNDAIKAAQQGNWFGGFGPNQSGGGFWANMGQILAPFSSSGIGVGASPSAFSGIGNFFGGIGNWFHNLLFGDSGQQSPDMGNTSGVGAGAGVGNPGGMTNYLRNTSGGGDQPVEHTFVAKVNWVEQNLSHEATAVAHWVEEGVQHAITAVAHWAEQNVQHAITAVAHWAEQNVIHPVVAAAEWTEQNVQHAVQAVANWTEQNVIHPVVAAAEWTEQNLMHAVTAVAQWGERNLEHTFLGVASWIGQNLFHTFVGVAQWIQQTITSVIPAFAEGVSDYGGPAIVGEAGSEVIGHNGQYMLVDQPTFVNLPSGSSVYPLSDLSSSSSPRMLASGTGGSITPILLGSPGGGGAQTANITVNLDSQTLISLLGANLMSSINVGMGKRSY